MLLHCIRAALCVILYAHFVSTTALRSARSEAADFYEGVLDDKIMFSWLSDDTSRQVNAYDTPEEKMATFYDQLSSLRGRRRKSLNNRSLRSRNVVLPTQSETKGQRLPIDYAGDNPTSATENDDRIDSSSLPTMLSTITSTVTASAVSINSTDDDATAAVTTPFRDAANDSFLVHSNQVVGNETQNKARSLTQKTGRRAGHNDDGRSQTQINLTVLSDTSLTTTRVYLKMGLHSARCLWAQYRKSKTEQELQMIRNRFKEFAKFWTKVVGVSVVIMWIIFGSFNELFCWGATAPPAEYAKNVNRYLMIVPPHVVVTEKGKMFRYQPTVEERFLWQSAKKIANFKI